MKFKMFLVMTVAAMAFCSCSNDDVEPAPEPDYGSHVTPQRPLPESTAKITIQAEDLKSRSTRIFFTPEQTGTYYVYNLMSRDDFKRFETAEEVITAELSYIRTTAENTDYKKLGYETANALIFGEMCMKGNSEWTVTELEPTSDYVAYAFYVTADMKAVDNQLAYCEITTTEPVYNFYGNALWHDQFVGNIFNMDGSIMDMNCDVYVDEETPGVYYFDSPYNYANIANWFDTTPEDLEPYSGNWHRTMISIDASDPDKVTMPLADLGCCLSSTYGFVMGGTQENKYGTYADDVITIPAKCLLWAMTKYQNGKTNNISGGDDFVVELFPGGEPTWPYIPVVEVRPFGDYTQSGAEVRYNKFQFAKTAKAIMK